MTLIFFSLFKTVFLKLLLLLLLLLIPTPLVISHYMIIFSLHFNLLISSFITWVFNIWVCYAKISFAHLYKHMACVTDLGLFFLFDFGVLLISWICAGYQSDDEMRRPSGNVDMSAFRTAVEDCMDYDVETAKKALKSIRSKNSTDLDVEKFSGLRIRYLSSSFLENANKYFDCFGSILNINGPFFWATGIK